MNTVPDRRVIRLVRAEWLKIRSLRSVRWIVIAFVLPTVAIIVGLARTGGTALAQSTEVRLAASVLPAVVLMQIAVAIVSVVVTGSEYTHGVIRASLTMAPRRGLLLTAKYVAAAGFGFLVGLVTAAIAIAITAVFSDRGGEWNAVLMRAGFGAGAYLAVLAVLAAALTVLVRGTATAVLIVIAVVYVVPLIAVPLIPGLTGTVGEFWPTTIGLTLVAPPGVGTVPPAAGFLVFVAECAIPVILSWLLFDRRDA